MISPDFSSQRDPIEASQMARQMMMQKAFYDGWVDAAARAAGSAMPCHG
jgi:hypothetical protein